MLANVRHYSILQTKIDLQDRGGLRFLAISQSREEKRLLQMYMVYIMQPRSPGLGPDSHTPTTSKSASEIPNDQSG